MADIIKLDMTKIWASSGDKLTPSDAQMASGWLVQQIPRQTWNWFENRQDVNIAYMLQKGIPEWDATTEYRASKSYIQRNGVVYKALQTSTNQDPATATTYWAKAFPESSAALEALRLMTPAANTMPYFTSGTAGTVTPLTPFARTILDDADALAVRTTIDAQLDNINLTTLSTVTAAANALPYFTGTNTATTTLLTAFGRSLIDDANAATGRTTLGLGNVSTRNVGTTAGTAAAGDDSRIVNALQKGNNLSDLTVPATARTNLGLGTAAVANVTTSANDATAGRLLKVGDFGVGVVITLTNPNLNTLIDSADYYCTGTLTNSPTGAEGWLEVKGITPTYCTQYYTNLTSGLMFVRQYSAGVWGSWRPVYAANNTSANVQSVLGAADYAAIRVLLGLNNTATAGANSNITSLTGLTTPLSAAQGGTGVTANTGTGNNVLSNSPTFTGVPLVPTAAFGANSTQAASTAFVIANATAFPPGGVLEFAGPLANAPAGFLIANGTTASRTTYAALFAAIGTTYGTGDGSTTFTLPDYRGIFRRGLDNGRGSDPSRTLGSIQGSANASHTHGASASAVGDHTHSGSTDTQGNHSHAVPRVDINTNNGTPIASIGNGDAGPGYTVPGGAHWHNVGTNPAGAHGHTITIGGSGGSESRPVNASVNVLIKF